MTITNNPRPPRKKFNQESIVHSYVWRPLGLEIVRALWFTKVTPNQLTIFRALVCVCTILLFFIADDIYHVFLAIITLEISYALDFADGLYARLKNKTSWFGSLLERLVDHTLAYQHNLLGLVIALTADRICKTDSALIAFALLSVLNQLRWHLVWRFERRHQNDHYRTTEYPPMFGVGFMRGFRNLVLNVFANAEQILVLGVALLFPLANHGINTVMIAFAILFLLDLTFVVTIIRMVFRTGGGTRDAT